MTTVVVVHEVAAPDKRALVALCDEHTVLLRKAAWARIDELVGFSTVIDCEACALINGAALDPHTVALERTQPHHQLHVVPRRA